VRCTERNMNYIDFDLHLIRGFSLFLYEVFSNNIQFPFVSYASNGLFTCLNINNSCIDGLQIDFFGHPRLIPPYFKALNFLLTEYFHLLQVIDFSNRHLYSILCLLQFLHSQPRCGIAHRFSFRAAVDVIIHI
jgi:hypothetical protein